MVFVSHMCDTAWISQLHFISTAMHVSTDVVLNP